MALGFAGLLALMGGLALDSRHQSQGAASASEALRKSSRERDSLLDHLRTDAYHSGTLVRDYLLERDDAAAANQRAEMERLRTRIEDSLSAYGAMVPAGERNSFENLRQHWGLYWRSLSPALDWNATVRLNAGEPFLRDTVIPRRDELVQIVRQLTALDERVLDAAEEGIQAVHNQFQRRVTAICVLALILGGILAIVVVRHVQHLERAAVQRLAEVQAARHDLRLLSDRLVKAQEEERRRLSRELHDDIGQSMSAMLMELGRFEPPPGITEVRRERFAAIRRMAEDIVAKVRNLALVLRPSMLDEIGLVPALRWHAREVARRTNLKVKMIADEIDENLPESHRTGVYRLVQEALNNCVQHSRATEVRVVIHQDEGGLTVSIQDDGVGFDAGCDKGLGLLGMAERVDRLGGRFSVESRPGSGAVVSAYFPMPAGSLTTVEKG